MFGWFKRAECRCQCPVQEDLREKAPKERTVPPTSPAWLLAASLTSDETRGEWTREYVSGVPGSYNFGHYTYRNDRRDLTITRYLSAFTSTDTLSSPFTLNKDEKVIVSDAVERFDKLRSDDAERAALARLTSVPAGDAPEHS